MRRVPHSATLLSWMIAAATIFVATACRDDDLSGPGTAASGSRPTFTIGDGSYDCPVEVPPEDCDPATQQERTDLWWDLQIGIRWDIEDCASHAGLRVNG